MNVGGSEDWSSGLGQSIGGSGSGNVVHTAELLPSGYLQRVGQVFQGYGDCLNPVNAVKGIVALAGVAHRQGVLAATSDDPIRVDSFGHIRDGHHWVIAAQETGVTIPDWAIGS